MRIDIWSDIACPWCWIGTQRFSKALANFEHADEVEVVLHSFQLDPTLPESHPGTELDYLVERKGASAEQIKQMFAGVAEQAAAEGLTINFDQVKVANSGRAHQLLHFAKAAGRDHELAQRLFAAHFRDGEVISDLDVLASHAEAVGLDPEAARASIESDEFAPAVIDDIDTAQQIGVQGVPFFVLDEQFGVSGAQPTEVFSQVLDEVWQQSRTAEVDADQV